MERYIHDDNPFEDPDYELSQHDCEKIVGYEIMIVPFDRVHDIDNVDDLFINNCSLVNYLQTEHSGHWVAMFRDNDTITYFDPCGNFIDEINANRSIAHQDKPYILDLLMESGYNVRCNDYSFQEGSSTCGRWSSYFLRCAHMGEEAFKFAFEGRKKRDILITMITADILNSP
jgi:hypothetical protein